MAIRLAMMTMIMVVPHLSLKLAEVGDSERNRAGSIRRIRFLLILDT